MYPVAFGPFEVMCPGPESVEAYDKDGGQGECLADAVQYLILHSIKNEVWDASIKVIEAVTGEKPVVDQKATDAAKARAKEGAKVSDVLEKPLTFVNSVMAAATPEQKAAIVEGVKKACGDIYIDPTPGRRACGPGAQFLKIADAILAFPADKVAKKVARLAEDAPEFVLEYEANGSPNRESLAYYVKAATESLGA